MDENWVHFLEQLPPPIAYIALACAGAIEYLVPPLPGDTFALLGVFLATTAGYAPILVYLSLTLGSAVGGQIAYGAGLWLARNPQRWPAFLREHSFLQKRERTILTLRKRLQKRGPAYLVINRFIPAFRSLFFVTAGLCSLPAGKVFLYGTISAALWNAGLFAIAYYASIHWPDQAWKHLEDFMQTYGVGVLTAGLLVALITLAIWYLRRRTGTGTGTGTDPH